MLAELCVLIEETCRIMGTILETYGKNCQEGQRICRSRFIILLYFEEISLHFRLMGIVVFIFADLCVVLF